jgi:hypothetical protein
VRTATGEDERAEHVELMPFRRLSRLEGGCFTASATAPSGRLM